MGLVLQPRLTRIVSMVQFSGRVQHAHSPKSTTAYRFCLILVSLLLSTCDFFSFIKDDEVGDRRELQSSPIK